MPADGRAANAWWARRKVFEKFDDATGDFVEETMERKGQRDGQREMDRKGITGINVEKARQERKGPVLAVSKTSQGVLREREVGVERSRSMEMMSSTTESSLLSGAE